MPFSLRQLEPDEPKVQLFHSRVDSRKQVDLNTSPDYIFTDKSLGYTDTPGKLTPGPGKYNPTYIPAKEPKAPAYSMGGRRIEAKPSNYPGPAECILFFS
jgi:hypothetical protein